MANLGFAPYTHLGLDSWVWIIQQFYYSHLTIHGQLGTGPNQAGQSLYTCKNKNTINLLLEK